MDEALDQAWAFLNTWTFYDTGSQLRDHISRRLKESLQQTEGRDILGKDATQKAFKTAIGGIKKPENPLNPKTTGINRTRKLTIENIILQSRTDYYVPCNVYYETDNRSRKPAILFLCGHEKNGKQNDAYQMLCQMFALHGFLVLAQETVGQGERMEYIDTDTGLNPFAQPTAEHGATGTMCGFVGENLAKYMVEDAMRSIDYLFTRDDVDTDKIAVTGNSGGGTQSLMLMLCEERIKACAIGTFISSSRHIFKSGKPQDSEQVWHGILQKGAALDHADLLAAICPRPVLLLAAEDDFFPIEGTLETANRTAEAYDSQNAGKSFSVFVEKVPHRYTASMAEAAIKFFGEQFGFTPTAMCEDAIQILEEQVLFCTSQGQIKIDYPRMDTIAKCALRKTRMPEGESRLQAWLRQAVMFERTNEPLFIKQVDEAVRDGLRCRRVIWNTQQELTNIACLFQSAESTMQAGVTLMLWHGGTAAVREHMEIIRNTCACNRIAVVLDVTGLGNQRPVPVNSMPIYAPYGTLYFLDSYLRRLGDSLAAIRCYDVLRAMDAMEKILTFRPDFAIYTEGKYGYYAEAVRMLRQDLQWEAGADSGCLHTALCAANAEPEDGLYIMHGIFNIDKENEK